MIHSPYGGQYCRDIGRFLRIRRRNVGPIRAKLPFAARCVGEGKELVEEKIDEVGVGRALFKGRKHSVQVVDKPGGGIARVRLG